MLSVDSCHSDHHTAGQRCSSLRLHHTCVSPTIYLFTVRESDPLCPVWDILLGETTTLSRTLMETVSEIYLLVMES